MNSKEINSEAGYVLILVLVVITVLTLVSANLLNQTVGYSFLTERRVSSVQALALAENAALEALWELKRNPDYRGAQSYIYQEGASRYEIIDPTWGSNDLSLTIFGYGTVGKYQTRIRLLVARPNLQGRFTITKWLEDP